MDGKAWWTTVHGVTKSRTQLSDFTSLPYFSMGFPSSSDGKESARNGGDLGPIPGPGISHGEGNDNPLQYSCLENSMDKEAWQASSMGSQRVGHD